jgi:hypothetical protein
MLRRTPRREELDSAKESQKRGGYAEPLGRVLVREFNVAQEKIDAVAGRLIEKAVYPFFFWKDGYFVFELSDYAETPEITRTDTLQHTLGKGLNPQFLAMEGLRLSDESEGPENSLGNTCGRRAASRGNTGKARRPYSRRGRGIRRLKTSGTIFGPVKRDREDGYFPKDSGVAVRSVSNSKGIMVLKEMLEELVRPMSLNEIVLLILEIQQRDSQQVGFVQREGRRLSAPTVRDRDKGEAPDDRVRKIRIPVSEHSILSTAINKKGSS